MQKAKPQLKIQNLLRYVVVLAFLFSGCARISENALNEILERDPAFGKVLEVKKGLDAEIAILKVKFEKENDTLVQKINLLREELREKRNALNTEMLALKEKLNPEINILQGKLSEKIGEYNLKIKGLKDLTDKLKNTRKVLNKKDALSLSADEIAVWNKRAANLESETASSSAEINKLKDKIRILKTEIRVLKE